MNRRLQTSLLALAAQMTVTSAMAAPQDPFAGVKPVDEADLGQERAGFVVGGVDIAGIGATVTATVNGNLALTSTLNINSQGVLSKTTTVNTNIPNSTPVVGSNGVVNGILITQPTTSSGQGSSGAGGNTVSGNGPGGSLAPLGGAPSGNNTAGGGASSGGGLVPLGGASSGNNTTGGGASSGGGSVSITPPAAPSLPGVLSTVPGTTASGVSQGGGSTPNVVTVTNGGDPGSSPSVVVTSPSQGTIGSNSTFTSPGSPNTSTGSITPIPSNITAGGSPVSPQGFTELVTNITPNLIQNMVVNTASGMSISLQTNVTLNLPGLTALQSAFSQSSLVGSLASATNLAQLGSLLH
jgi:hypothetical protein